MKNVPTARPAVEVGLLYVLSIFWLGTPFHLSRLMVPSDLSTLAFNAFSTARWRHVPMNCASIPDEYADMRSWCVDVQGLKAFVWIEFVARMSPPALRVPAPLTPDHPSLYPFVSRTVQLRSCASSPTSPTSPPPSQTTYPGHPHPSFPHCDVHAPLRDHRAPRRT